MRYRHFIAGSLAAFYLLTMMPAAQVSWGAAKPVKTGDAEPLSQSNISVSQSATQKSQAPKLLVQKIARPITGKAGGGKVTKPVKSAAKPKSAEKTMVVPPNTVLMVQLQDALHSGKNNLGDPVHATVTEPVFLGPYLAIPAQSELVGRITQLNDKRDELGRYPYIVVTFNAVRLPEREQVLPFSGSLIAYKNGLRNQDYIWELPNKDERKRNHMKGIVGGALSGFFINPVLGPPIGAGAALLKNGLTDKFARGGSVKIKANEPLPIATDEAIPVPVALNPANPVAEAKLSDLERPVAASTEKSKAVLEHPAIGYQSKPASLTKPEMELQEDILR